MYTDVLVSAGVKNAEDAVVVLADVALVTAADKVDGVPIPFAANSDLTRLKYV